MAMKRNFVVIVLGMAMFLCAQADGSNTEAIGEKLKKNQANAVKLKNRATSNVAKIFGTKQSDDKGADAIECNHDLNDRSIYKENGVFIVENRSIGGTATLTCNEGFRRVSSNGEFFTGPEVFTCDLVDEKEGVARWSTQTTTCEQIYCDEEPTLDTTNTKDRLGSPAQVFIISSPTGCMTRRSQYTYSY
eukprot:263775_1